MIELDAIDLRILSLLQVHGDIKNVVLAEQVGLSASPCLQRVRRLRKLGVIKSVGAVIDVDKVFRSVRVYVRVSLSDQSASRFASFEEAINDVPEVLECSLMSGEFNYLLKVVCPGIEQFDALMDGLMRRKIGIKSFSILVEIRSVKQTSAIPLGSLVRG
jgi:DNA-binding Lrp family transcriptional regulator